LGQSYVCIAPTSVWFTKQWPAEGWVSVIQGLPIEIKVFLLGAPTDREACEAIKTASKKANVTNLAGQLSLLTSAALMQEASMNYVNDSAPMHMASAVNAATTAVYCSTIPTFGFGPLSDQSRIVQTDEKLRCRPCGLHGHSKCPEGHFKCATSIDWQSVLQENGKIEG
jgi:heptosyltransferase II